MIYEFRTYVAVPGKMSVLLNHVRVAKPLFSKHGLPSVGYWTEEVGESNRLHYIWVCKDEAERHRNLATFAADPEWKAYRAQEDKESGVFLERSHSRVMVTTPYSPEPRLAGSVQELQFHDVMPGKLPQLHEHFSKRVLPLSAKHGVHTVGCWTETFGTGYRLVCMFGYDSMAGREQSMQALADDKEWRKAQSDAEQGGGLIGLSRNWLLRPQYT